MSAPTNVAEAMPVTTPIPLDEEVINLDALAQQLVATKAKNEGLCRRRRIMRRGTIWRRRSMIRMRWIGSPKRPRTGRPIRPIRKGR